MGRQWMLAIALGGCAAPTGTWMAHGERASVALVRDGDEVVAYVCGAGETNVTSWTRWFATASFDGDGFVTERDGWQLRADLVDDEIEVDLDGPTGQAASWTARQDPEGGLFAHIGNCRDAAVVLDGEVVGAWCDIDLGFWQVEPVGTLIPRNDEILTFRAMFEGAPEFEATRVFP